VTKYIMKKGGIFSHESATSSLQKNLKKTINFKKIFFFAKIKYCTFQMFQASTERLFKCQRDIFVCILVEVLEILKYLFCVTNIL